jgi:hypothetical protein
MLLAFSSNFTSEGRPVHLQKTTSGPAKFIAVITCNLGHFSDLDAANSLKRQQHVIHAPQHWAAAFPEMRNKWQIFTQRTQES